MNIHNKDGSVSAYGMACGYVDTSHGCGTRIERRGSGFLARADGGHAVLYLGPRLLVARAACKQYARLARKYWHGDYCMESQCVGQSYVVRVRHFGVIIGTGATVAEAMNNAAKHEANA